MTCRCSCSCPGCGDEVDFMRALKMKEESD